MPLLENWLCWSCCYSSCRFDGCIWEIIWFSWDCTEVTWDCDCGVEDIWVRGSCPGCKDEMAFLGLNELMRGTICFSYAPNFSLKLGIMMFLGICRNVIMRSNIILYCLNFSTWSDLGCWGVESYCWNLIAIFLEYFIQIWQIILFHGLQLLV